MIYLFGGLRTEYYYVFETNFFQEKNKDVDNAINYLKTIFWHYANNEQRYNYSQVSHNKKSIRNMLI